MADFPTIQDRSDLGICMSTSVALLGLVEGAAPSSSAWTAANLAVFIPFRVSTPQTIRYLAVGAGATAAGNFDVGVFDQSGHKLVSSGATAKGNGVEQIIDVTDTRIGPGLYYLGMAADGTNNYTSYGVTAEGGRLMGILEQATAYTLPATATFANLTAAATRVPWIAAYTRAI